MNMRKIIAVLAAVLLLCAAIPMAAMSVSAASKLDNNFDDGTVGKFKCDSVDTIVNEDGVMKWTTQGWKNLYASFSVSANADYKVTFKMKAAAATSMEVKYLNGSWGDSGIAKDTISIGTDWTEYTRILNAGSNNALVLLFQSHKATDVYIDDVKVVDYVAPVDPVFPEDAIYVETFESASLNGWTSNCSVVSTDGLAATKADGGNYCLEFISPNYSYTNYKLTVEKNTDYKVIFSVLSATSGYPLNARVRDGSGDLGYVSYTPSTTAWETHSYIFNSGNNTSVNLRFQAGWSTGTYYLDNICVVPFDRSTMTNDGHVLNGDWETGDATEWANSPNVEVVADPTGAGQGYVIKTFETSSSAVDMFVQEFKNLVVGKEYTLSFKVYGYGTATNNAFFVRFPKAFTTWSVHSALASAKNNDYTPRINVNAMTNAWYDVNITFTAQAATAKVQFMNYRSGQGFYYFDDVTLSHAYDAVVTTPDCVNGGYTTYTCACGNSYTANETAALGHNYNEGICGVCGAEDPNYVPPHTCNVVEQDRVEATCTADGYISYACDCGLGAYTETIPAKGHTAGAAADCENAQICTVCGAELAAALGHDWDDATCTAPKTCSVCGATDGDALGHVYDNDCDPDCNVCFENREELNHNVIHVAAKAATCTATGNIEYWYCDACGMAWLDEACTLNTNLRAVNLPMAEHTYFDDCSAICEVCGYEREAGHNVIHVAAKAATCTEMGNIEYWYCDACGMAWLDEACTLNTNLRAVKLAATGEHTYDNAFDTTCNECGAVRAVAGPVSYIAKSISEDVSGLAMLFQADVEGIVVKAGTFVQADFTNATYNGYKLIGLGVKASNGVSETNIEGLRMYELEDGCAKFAFRVINIPADKLDVEITMTPYYVVEIDGVATTIEGEAVVGSYAEVAADNG